MPNLFQDERRSLFNIYDDWVFHHIFCKGTEKTNRALVGILNIILDRREDPIKDLKIENPIQQGETENDKETILDIKATTNSGENIDIEMQNGKLNFLKTETFFTPADWEIPHWKKARIMVRWRKALLFQS